MNEAELFAYAARDAMKDAGVDFLNGDPVGDALNLFDDTVTQLEKALLQ